MGGAMNASLETTLAIELFLNDNYLFRHNVLNGKVEFAVKSADDEPDFRPLTQEALNSIIRRAKKEQVCEKGSPKTEIMEFVHSEDVPTYNPIGDYLARLPKWDGQNHIAKLFNRLPGITSEQQGFLTIWLRSVVAHWLQMDQLHGNECVPTLIGAQGEVAKSMNSKMMLKYMQKDYPSVEINHSNRIKVGLAMKSLGYEWTDHSNVPFYKVVPITAA